MGQYSARLIDCAVHAGPVTRSAAAASHDLPQDDEQDENASLAANSQHPAEAADRRKKRQTAPRRSIQTLHMTVGFVAHPRMTHIPITTCLLPASGII